MMGEVELLRKKCFRRNDTAQVLGLPMYLIIVMIVAVAVIAAVIFMITQGTGLMNAQIIDNVVIAEEPGNASAVTFSSYNVTVKVSSRQKSSQPIAGATVTLIGSGDVASNLTDANGIACLQVTPSLKENCNENYMKLQVKAAGYQEYSDKQAVTIYRLK